MIINTKPIPVLPLEGIHKIPMADYRSDPGISKSSLDRLHRSPAEYRDYIDGKIADKPTAAMEFGTMLHALVLDEPLPFHVQPDTYGPEQKRWNNNATECRQWCAEHADRTIISASDARKLWDLATAVKSDPRAKALLMAATGTEASCFVADQKTRLRLKGRPDIIGPDFIADIKTTSDASTFALSRTIATYRYHVQAAMYRRILGQLGRPTRHWYFIAVETGTYPRINVRRLTDLAIAQGETELDADLELLQQCMEDGCWPGLSGPGDEIGDVDLPTWAYTHASVELVIGGQTMTV
jgi:exodeoxyribonuclease VIII